MGKRKVDSSINLELTKFQGKLEQFQQYLEKNSIITQVTKDDSIIIAPESQDQLHKEILIQIKMQDAVLVWLPLLEKLKDKEAAQIQTLGDVEIKGMFKKKFNKEDTDGRPEA